MTSPGTRAQREARLRARPDLTGAALPHSRPTTPGRGAPDPRPHRHAHLGGQRPPLPPQAGHRPGRPAPTGGPRPALAPLVARREPLVRTRRAAPPPGGWVRRFVRRHGWRAYALPLLTIATVVTLADMATTPIDGKAVGSAAGAVSSSAPAPTAGAPADPSAEGEGVPVETPAAPPAATYAEQGAGSVSVVDGDSEVYGTGPLKRFVVEVEDGTDVDGAQFAAAVENTLGDPRSWGNGGQMSFQRVGAAEAAAGQYDFKVSLVSPGSMETYCPGVGTGGYTSCRYGERAVINLARWETAVPDYDGDIATYRRYVVNHEVGHALGHGHEQCTGPGQPAPVMEQQTLGLQGCVKNAWPYPP